ncbi:uncharacterized protein METZ01_LOCUS216318 [marine metagenome]|uniref:Uncharacterized protein n=1 Tax=marine metagenome TaxID=408172 RepID=A0A382FM86_9ZZZZ
MDDNKKKLIYAKWRTLVRTMKLTVQTKSDPAYIFEEWCPKNPTAGDIIEFRPQLRDIFEQAMEGTLVREGHPKEIVRLMEFNDLMRTVHDGSKPAPEADLLTWSKREIDEVTLSMWNDVDAKSKMYLRHCLRNYLSFEEKMDDLDKGMASWRKGAASRLKKLEKLRDNPDLPTSARHDKTIVRGKARLEDVTSIRAKIPVEIMNFKKKFQEAILDVLFNTVDISEVPEWSKKMTDIQKRNESVIPDFLTLQVDDPRDEDKDTALKQLRDHLENKVKVLEMNAAMKKEEEEIWKKVREL